MKVLIVLALAAVACANAVPTAAGTPGYSIIENHLIPLGEKVRKAEEELSKGRIAGGIPSNLGEFPYQAGLLANFIDVNGTGICGGSLVSSNRVITAAHCWFDGVHQAWRLTVVLGSVTIYSGGVRQQTSVVAMHPQWNPDLIRDDVAVIYLPTPVAFSSTISPIALPSGNELSQNFAGASAIASGFGLTGDGAEITIEQFLSHVTLNVLPHRTCSFAFPFVFQSSNICTSGAGGVSTCRGDSGGPLVVNSNGRRILIGVTSFGLAFGCELGYPAVFARTTSYINFFNQHIA
ncbi:brachyurin-like [Anticarsia gemmatalis]|uniref:brachyurin-like n=1 Tax=Anticarsia gemmatalis TaxID=129554 RepID=UPI003F771477